MVHANYTEACEKGSGACPGPWPQASCRCECHQLKLMTLASRLGLSLPFAPSATAVFDPANRASRPRAPSTEGALRLPCD